MNFDFKSARHWAEELIRAAVQPGARIIDATLGNGYDTLWLAELTGEEGHIYGFDIQLEAVNRTRERLKNAGLDARATLFHAGHEHIAELVGEEVDAAVFNLGWLPGTDKSLRTRAETTLTAVNAALEKLKEGGIVTICVYPGHPEGRDELNRLIDWGRTLPSDRFDVMTRAYLNQAGDPPVLIAIKKNKTRKRR